MGGAQPLAATFAGALSLVVECDAARIEARLRTRYLDLQARDLAHALALIEEHTARREAVSVGLLGNAADVLPELARRAHAGGPRPSLVTDQTSAHDLVHGYLPEGWSVSQWRAAQLDPAQHAELVEAASRSCARHVQAMLDFHATGVPTLDFATTFARWLSTGACETPLTSQGLCRPASDRCCVRARGRSAGSRCRATPKTSGAPTRRSSSCFPKTTLSTAGSIWPLSHRLPGSAGAYPLAGAGRAARGRAGVQRHGAQRRAQGTHRHRKGTIWTPDRWPAPTARPRA